MHASVFFGTLNPGMACIEDDNLGITGIPTNRIKLEHAYIMRHDAGLFVVVVHGVRPHHQGACACGRHAVDFDHGSVIVGKCIIASSARKSIIIMLARAMLARAMPAKAMPAKAKHANAMLGRGMLQRQCRTSPS